MALGQDGMALALCVDRGNLEQQDFRSAGSVCWP